MKDRINLKIDRQFTIFIVILFSLHLTFRVMEWSGQFALLVLIPFLFSTINFFAFIVKGISKSIWEFKYLLVVLLYFMFSLKVGFNYYNILFPIFLVTMSVYILRFKDFKIPKLKYRLIFLIATNILIIVTPDLLIFKYFNSVNKQIWGDKLVWVDFKGKIPKNIGEMDAGIDSDIYWKFNEVYNFPRFISLAVMVERRSWVRPEYNDYEGNLLKHEQLHFDITEWTRREFHDSLYSCEEIDYDKAIEIYNHFLTIESQRQSDYDSISKHGIDFNGQIKWNKKVKQGLE